MRRTNRRAIAMTFVRLSVCLSETGVHCDHTVRFREYVGLLFDSPISGHPDTKVRAFTANVFFQFHLEERWVMDVQTRRSIKR